MNKVKTMKQARKEMLETLKERMGIDFSRMTEPGLVDRCIIKWLDYLDKQRAAHKRFNAFLKHKKQND